MDDYSDLVTQEQLDAIQRLVDQQMGPFNPDDWEEIREQRW
jgi:non-homologous end joining protein Ku